VSAFASCGQAAGSPWAAARPGPEISYSITFRRRGRENVASLPTVNHSGSPAFHRPSAPVKIADDIGERIPGPTERDYVIAAQLYGPPS
jgi:hypothetical protein